MMKSATDQGFSKAMTVMRSDANKTGLSRRLLGFFEKAVTEFYAGGFTPQPGTLMAKFGEHLSERPALRLAFGAGLGLAGLVAISSLTGPLTIGHMAGTWLLCAATRAGYNRLNAIAPGLDDSGQPFKTVADRDDAFTARRQQMVDRAAALSAMAGSPGNRGSKAFQAAFSDAMWQATKLKHTPNGVEGEAGFWRRPGVRLAQNLAVPLLAANFLGLPGTLGVLLIEHLRRRAATEANAAIQRKHGGAAPAGNDNPLLPPAPTRISLRA